MKIALAFLRIDLDDGEIYRLAAFKHYESGHGNAGVDPRALAAMQFGTTAQQIQVLVQWEPFDFALKGGMLIDPELFVDALTEADDMRVSDQLGAIQGWISMMTSSAAILARHMLDPIPDRDSSR